MSAFINAMWYSVGYSYSPKYAALAIRKKIQFDNPHVSLFALQVNIVTESVKMVNMTALEIHSALRQRSIAEDYNMATDALPHWLVTLFLIG